MFAPVGKGNALDIHWLETEETANSPGIQRMRIVWPHMAVRPRVKDPGQWDCLAVKSNM